MGMYPAYVPRMAFLFCLSIFTFLVPSQGFAQPWNNRFASNSFSRPLQLKVLGHSQDFKLTRASLYVTKKLTARFATLQVDEGDFVSVDDMNNFFNNGVPHFDSLHDSADVLIVVLPSNYELTASVLGNDEGRAQGIGLVPHHRQPYALVRAQQNPLDQGKIIAHEIGHLLGATHCSHGIMQPHFEQVITAFDFASDSLRQIQDSLHRSHQPFVSFPAPRAVAVSNE